MIWTIGSSITSSYRDDRVAGMSDESGEIRLDTIPKVDFLGMTLDTRLSTVRPCDKRVQNMLTRVAWPEGTRQINKKSLFQPQGTRVSLGDICEVGDAAATPISGGAAPPTHPQIADTTGHCHTRSQEIGRVVVDQRAPNKACQLSKPRKYTLVTDAPIVGWGATVSDIPIQAKPRASHGREIGPGNIPGSM